MGVGIVQRSHQPEDGSRALPDGVTLLVTLKSGSSNSSHHSRAEPNTFLGGPPYLPQHIAFKKKFFNTSAPV
jgi:hypothetical protein